MKKTIMFLGVLSLGLAQAQQNDPFEGRVGVNTDTPSATLNVKSKTGTTATTKNFELENANGTKMVTVLDNGNVGINKVDPKGILDVYGTSIFRPKTENDAVWVLSNPSVRGASGLIHTQIAPEVARADYAGFKEYTLNTGSAHRAIYRLSFIPNLTQINDSKPMLTILGHNGNVGIGEIDNPTNKLHIKADEDPLKLEGLQAATGTNTQNLVIENGVVKVGEAVSSGAIKVGTTANAQCTDTTIGTINFGEVTVNNEKRQAFGFCTKDANGTPMWAYMVAGNNPFSSTNPTFGEGL